MEQPLQWFTDPATPTVAMMRGVGLVLFLEILFLGLRRSRAIRIGWLQHLWALSMGAFTAVFIPPVPFDSASLSVKLTVTLAVLLSGLVVFSLVDAVLLQTPWDEQRPPLAPKLLIDVVRVLLLAGLGLGAATIIFDVHLSTILVSSTVVSAVIGFALQDVLKNVFAGMALQMESPFENHDWLLIDGHPAQVIEMNWRSTRLRTNEGVILIEPNANMANMKLTCYGNGDPPVAFPFRIGLPREIPPARVKEALLEAAKSAPHCVSTPAPCAYVDEYTATTTVYHLRAWTTSVSSLVAFRDDIQSHMWYSLQRRGIPIPFETHSLHLHDMGGAEERRQAEEREHVSSILSGVDLFRDLAAETVGQLAAAAERYYYADGENLVVEGQAGDTLFLIDLGSVTVSQKSEAGDELMLAKLGPGDFFGEASLLTGEPRSATVTAIGPCEVLVIGKEQVAPVMADDPNMAWSLSRALAARTAAAAEVMEQVSPVGDNSEAGILKRIQSFFKLS